jgi:hypothetical protein
MPRKVNSSRVSRAARRTRAVRRFEAAPIRHDARKARERATADASLEVARGSGRMFMKKFATPS